MRDAPLYFRDAAGRTLHYRLSPRQFRARESPRRSVSKMLVADYFKPDDLVRHHEASPLSSYQKLNGCCHRTMPPLAEHLFLA